MISVVVPIYNAEKTLDACLQSISTQLFLPKQVVLINDGSTDNSLVICGEWAKNKDFEIIIYSQENKGLGAARNSGISRCSQKWVAFLDADDIWNEYKLELCHSHLLQQDCDVLYHEVNSFGLGTEKKRAAWPINSLQDLLLKGNPIFPSAVVVKKSNLLDHPFQTNPQFHGAEDLYLWIELLEDGKIFDFMNQALCQYRESGGMSTQLENHLEHVQNVLNHFLEKAYFTQIELKQAWQRKNYEAARFYHKRGLFKQAKKHYSLTNSSLKINTLQFLGRLKIKI